MLWIYLCAAIWLLALLIVKPIRIRRYIKTGLLALLLALLFDWNATHLGLYAFHRSWLSLAGIPLFYLLATIPVGILIVVYVPKKRLNQFLYIGGASALLVMVEQAALALHMISYTHWHWLYSFQLYAFAIMILLTLHQTFYLWSIWRA